MSLSRARRSGITANTTPKKSRSLSDASGLPGIVKSLTATTTGNTTASLSWSAPDISGDSSITSYAVSGGGTASISGTSATITGLTGGTSYTFTVRAVNSVGQGIPATSNQITTTNTNEASGGTVTTVSNYNGTGETWKVHTFDSNGTFTVTSAPNTFRVLLVQGGNGGGPSNDGATGFGGNRGGVGGKVYSSDSVSLSTGAISVTVGNGGGVNAAGGNSTLGALSSANGSSGGTGGSGGPPEGPSSGGAGGAGPISNITGTSLRYAGGGGGGGCSINLTTGSGGAGGDRGGGAGGTGSGYSPGAGTAGTANTGGGGGGGARVKTDGQARWASSASGGSGIVVISYKI